MESLGPKRKRTVRVHVEVIQEIVRYNLSEIVPVNLESEKHGAL
jgi:hypothetical protein